MKLLLYLFFPFLCFAQSDSDYVTTPGLRFVDFEYVKSIKTVQLYADGFELSDPILRLNSDERLKLSFDDLDAEYKNISYSIVHCNSDWQSSDLSTGDYVNGFTENYITEFTYSFNTFQRFIHYNAYIPNGNYSITKSGNYLLKVYLDNDPEKLLLTRRFMVVEEGALGVQAKVDQPVLINDKFYKQKIDFTLNYNGLNVLNPYTDIRVVIRQNGRWDNAITNLKPQYVKDGQLVYNYDEENVFSGGNEFRYADTKSIRYLNERMARIDKDSALVHAFLVNDDKRAFKKYVTFNDINGRFLVKINEGSNSEREADYIFVHFTLPWDEPVFDGNIYVFGALTNWQCKKDFRMKYNDLKKRYELTAFLKQGYYNYQYVYLNDKEQVADETMVEGMHYETENDYTILVYYHATGTQYEQLIAIKKINLYRPE